MKPYSPGRIRRSLLHTVFFRALSQLATVASYVVLVRGMTEQAFGVLNLLYAVIPVISTTASLGIEQTMRRYQPEYLQSGNAPAAAWLLRVASSTRFATNLIFLGTVLLLWRWIAPIFHLQPYRDEFMLFSLLVLLHFQASILQISLSSHMLQGYSVGMTVVLSVAKLLAYLALNHFHELTLTNAILADTLGYGLMYTGLRIAHAKYSTPRRLASAFRPDPAERRRLLRYSFFNNFNDAGTLLLTAKSDNLFIAALMNPVAVGTYSFYVRLNEMASQLLPTRQFSNVIQPLFFSVPASEAPQKIPRYFSFLLNLTNVVQLPMAGYATAFHSEIVTTFFGGKFADHSWLLPVIAWFATVGRIGDPVTLTAQYQEKASIILLSKIFALYNLVAILALVPIAGVYGAAIATGSAQVMKNIYLWWHVRDIARWGNFRAVLTMTVLIWGSFITVCIALKRVLVLPTLAHLALGALLCGAAAIMYARSPALSASDRQLLAGVFHGREARLLERLGIVRKGVSSG
jgi:O-antigen/teichoic acid export membrane protein